ncbi:hypothetical protein [Tahibacter harae]|uniref:S9 family peptidase n=1 Tax=Tahibacter harae TaxID=2963937 RepID=A0ABT1QSQ1_9GAMM|nr:hypothetical protein [Tahibacter harae]MCQ4165318.1 hypothetical protein [Tahibacter harae]
MRPFPATVLLAPLLGAAAARAAVVPQIAGLLRDARLDEVSGLAVSQRDSARLWLHNDSGNRAEVFAVDTKGALLARVLIAGIKPLDWEDMSSFTLDGKPYLLIADTGDNGAVRKSSELIVIEEPSFRAAAAPQELQAAPAWRIRFRYADAPHDVEAVTVDAAAKRVLLLTKRTDPPQLWSLPLRPAGDAEQVAQHLGDLAVSGEAVPAAAFQRRLQPGRPTGFAISRDGRSAVVLTYASVWRYTRAAAESWEQALARKPQVFPFGLLAQAEAVAVSYDGAAIYLSGERWPAPLLRIDIAPP